MDSTSGSAKPDTSATVDEHQNNVTILHNSVIIQDREIRIVPFRMIGPNLLSVR